MEPNHTDTVYLVATTEAERERAFGATTASVFPDRPDSRADPPSAVPSGHPVDVDTAGGHFAGVDTAGGHTAGVATANRRLTGADAHPLV